ncbi:MULTISPECIES: hypothetical protein [unclassified Clostridium]|uniref:hypothetical protein n=1 Tax=unclassified Clostridium TaxID=2614128 RepID=UPI00207AA39D|nr:MULTISPECIES: hypothetical protein [unclassified Clostridium]
MKLNNVYNFKNPVKHFLDIDSLKMPGNIEALRLYDLSWTESFKFRVKKSDSKFRTLKIPNILNFVRAYYFYNDLPNFEDVQQLDIKHKRLSANIETGDFAGGEFDIQLEKDFERLCIYDELMKLDIKDYYGRIYTHRLDKNQKDERYFTNLNLGATNGLIMGNYLSLYFAESYLAEISKELEQRLQEQEIECEFTYFSDDFYFYYNKGNQDNIIKIFDYVLESHELERNEGKLEVWNYESFNNYNVVERYWKKVMSHCNTRFNDDSDKNKLYFINQLIYRMSKLKDDKLKRVFINNFFKTKYFQKLDLEKFKVKIYDYHQLCFLMKFTPECMLYLIDRLDEMSDFDNDKLYEFFKVRYSQSLKSEYNEEQLYYHYAIKKFKFDDILRDVCKLVLKSNNQVLISYYLKEKLFDGEGIDYLKQKTDEEYWFQNYHLILYNEDLLANLESSISKYIMPKNSFDKPTDDLNKMERKRNQRNHYMNFYKENLLESKAIIRDIDDVGDELNDYLELKFEEVSYE